MSSVLLLSSLLSSGVLGALQAPTELQVEQAVAPAAVNDHRPDFRARNQLSGSAADRFQIQVTTDPTFLTITHWNSAAPDGGTLFPGGVTVPNGSFSPDIPYGQGTANLLTVPMMDWNTTYYWQTRFGRNTTWSGFSAGSQFTLAAPFRSINQHQNNGSPTGDSWRFIGVPIAFGTTVPATELLDDVSLLYRLDEPSRTWIPMGPGDVLQGGRGYLAWGSPTAALDLFQGKVTPAPPRLPSDPNQGTTTPSYAFNNLYSFTTSAVPVGQEVIDGVPANEYRGNHLFANPFNAPLSWRSSTTNGPPYGHMARTNISFAIYKWDGTQYLTHNGVTNVGSAGEWIEPFQAVGIWVQAANHLLWIDSPPPASSGPAKPGSPGRASAPAVPPPDPERWALMIEAASGASLDTENAFGIDPEADDAWDVRDSEEPGQGNPPWVLVSFDHRSDWTVYPRKYTHDFRKTPLKAGDRVVWTFTVDGTTNLPATLTWPNHSGLPLNDWRFTLEDPATAATVDLSLATSYDTLPVNGPMTLTLTAERLKDAPPPPATGSGGGKGGSCALVGPELLLLCWIAGRMAGTMRRNGR
ncbi:MAG TPA: hypothetical protein VJB14_07665 [Planctomycetota bacterium]|nr:hypothetical protein [Planctomycetota bacterium]